MLVLSRKKSEEFVIPINNGELIRVMVVEIRGNKVRLGIVAPQDIPVHRKEVFDATAATATAGRTGAITECDDGPEGVVLVKNCARCNDGMPSHRVNSLCEECYAEEWQNDCDDEADIDHACEQCYGTGKAPDNGTNMGECEECNGTGVV